MNQSMRRLATAAVVLGGLVLLGGCQDKLKAERDALYEANSELQQENYRLKQALEGAEGRAMDLQQQLREYEMRLAQRREAPQPALTGFEGIPGVEGRRGPGTVTARVEGDILFASGKIDLKPAAKQTLQRIASVIKSRYPGNTIRVEGYTDSDPIRKSKWKDNLELSLQRAAAVHRYMQTLGFNKDRLYAAGFGESKPAESKARSRRVEIVVILDE